MKPEAKQTTGRPFTLQLSQSDPPNVLELFALALAEANQAWRVGDNLIPQGTLWQGWCVQNGFQLEGLQALIRLDNPVIHWPPPLKEAHRLIRESPAFRAALNCVLKHHQVFHINEGAELARILAAVAQTLRRVGKAGASYQRTNRYLAEQVYPAAQHRLQEALRQPQPPPQKLLPAFDLRLYQERLDEQGAKVMVDGLEMWHASHRGPVHAGKLKNQDATFALAVGDNLVFAVADGVSTSMGSRMAAAIVARSFCEHLATCLHSLRPEEGLHAAAMKAQEYLDRLLTTVEKPSHSAEFDDLYDGLQPAAVKRILENTRTRKNRSLPMAFATTLLGGFVSPVGNGSYQVHFMCVGDGLVEHHGKNGSITAVLGMDNQETAISATICPGPFGQESLRQITVQTSRLTSGDCLLFSSDGLTRGHQQSVWWQLESIRAFPNTNSEQLAWQILDRACRVADTKVEEPRLFGDNLSLLLLTAQ